MSRFDLLSHSFKIAVFASVGLAAGPALGVQPLEQFLQAARDQGFEAREQRVFGEQRSWEREAAKGRLLPALTARGIYQRNQEEAAVQLPNTNQRLVLSPQNQWDAVFQLDVPVVDLASYYRYAQARELAAAASAQQELALGETSRAVASAYYSYVGASALSESAKAAIRNAEANAELVRTRREVGMATELDVERARANVERARQDLADAGLVRAIAARQLETLARMAPAPVTRYPEDDLHAEAPIERWISVRGVPSDRLQARLSEAAAEGEKAARAALLPTLSASAQQRFSNAVNFAGETSVYTLQAVLSWRLDYGTYSAAKAQATASELQTIRAERARRTVEDNIFEAHSRVGASIAKSHAARAQAQAARKAAELALERYQAGVATQLDVTQSQREAFQAEAARIQADADLSFARALLRIAAGRAPGSAAPLATSPPAARGPATPGGKP